MYFKGWINKYLEMGDRAEIGKKQVRFFFFFFFNPTGIYYTIAMY